MTEQQAFRLSIQHWYRHASGTAGEKEGINSKACALCVFVGRTLHYYSRRPILNCNICPIQKYTHEKLCGGISWFSCAYHKGDHFRFQEAAWDMLQDLLRIYKTTYGEDYYE